MNKIKHSKYRNTAILYDVLLKQLMHEAMIKKGNVSVSNKIIKKFFGTDTLMSKELKMYRSLCENKFSNDTKALYHIDNIVSARRKLNSNKLNEEKYALIKEIKKHYDLDAFFKMEIKNYKQLASIYQIFEYDERKYPTEISKFKINLSEHLIKNDEVEQLNENANNNDTLDQFRNMNVQMRNLVFKLMVENYNKTFSGLLTEQKDLLGCYIMSTDAKQLLEGFRKAAKEVKKDLTNISKDNKVDAIIKIKVDEVNKLLCKFKDIQIVNENHIYSLMNYMQLINEIKKGVR